MIFDRICYSFICTILKRWNGSGCSDFSIYEDALRWYETYYPYYGDVAKLDRDGDGVPCPGLPHTKVSEIYRMKKPLPTKDVNRE